MRPEDRDILFGDRFGAWDGAWHGGADAGPWPMPGADIEALMDAYFDGEISDDDRVRLFGLLRRDPDRCLQFVEMQRTALLLERAPAGPDQTESILNSLGRYQVSQGGLRGRSSYRIGPRAMRGAIAATVMLAGAGLVMLGQWGGSASQRAFQPETSELARAPERSSDAASIGAAADASAPASSTPSPAGRPALRPGELRSVGGSLARDGGQIETTIRGLAGPDQRLAPPPSLVMDPTGEPRLDPFQGFDQTSPRDLRRLMGLTHGYMPWGMYTWSAGERWAPPPPQPAPQRTPQMRD